MTPPVDALLSLFLGVLAVVTVQAGAEIAQRALLSDIEIREGKDAPNSSTCRHIPRPRRWPWSC